MRRPNGVRGKNETIRVLKKSINVKLSSPLLTFLSFLRTPLVFQYNQSHPPDWPSSFATDMTLLHISSLHKVQFKEAKVRGSGKCMINGIMDLVIGMFL